MADLTITNVSDTWTNDARPGVNYGSAAWVQAQSSSRRMFVRPHLGSIADRTVVAAYLTGHSGGTAAQTLTIAPLTERVTMGQLTAGQTAPTVNAGAAVSVAIPALADGESFDLTGLEAMFQAVADGTDYYGFRITTNYAVSAQKFYSKDSGSPAWELHLELSDAPEAPTDLRPEGGAVESTTPILAWEYADVGDDASDQSESRVQVDTPTGGADPDEVAPDYDSGWEANGDAQWDLDGEHTLSGAGPHYWRVQVRDADSDESDWSDWAEFTYSAARSIVIDSPTGAFGDPTPTVLAHLSTGTLTKWRAKVTGPDRSDVRARTGVVVQDGGTIEWTIPLREEQSLTASDATNALQAETVTRRKKVFRGPGPWWLHIRAWDERDLATAVGQAPYMETWVQLEFDDDLGVTPPTGLIVGQLSPGDPRRRWSWARTEDADAWVVTIDGEPVARVTTGEEVTVNAGRYEWVDSGEVAPLRPQVLRLHAIDGNDRSAAAQVDVEPDHLPGVWLIPEADGIDPIVFAGTDVNGWTREDFVATYVTSTGDEVDVTYGKPGRRGTFEGFVDNRDGDVWEVRARIEALRQSRNRNARLVWGTESIAIRVRSIDSTPSGEILPNNLQRIARFSFIEQDV